MPTDLYITRGDLPDIGDPIAELQSQLRKYPQVRVEGSPSRVLVRALDAKGFEVGFEVDKDRCTVFCDGWHEEFSNRDEATACFSMALSQECRLKVWRRAGIAYRWELQKRDADEWKRVSTRSRLLFPLWARLEIVYLQNSLLEAA